MRDERRKEDLKKQKMVHMLIHISSHFYTPHIKKRPLSWSASTVKQFETFVGFQQG